MKQSEHSLDYTDLESARLVTLTVYYVLKRKDTARLMVRTADSDIQAHRFSHAQRLLSVKGSLWDEKISVEMGRRTESNINFKLARQWIKKPAKILTLNARRKDLVGLCILQD